MCHTPLAEQVRCCTGQTANDVFETLPVVARIGRIKVRWLEPMVELGHRMWLSDLSGGALGTLEDCG
jgi:hypothetical protein